MSKSLLLPNLIIVGVNKGGTTSLFSYLSMHPDIAPAKKKETCYFLPLRYGKNLAPLKKYSQYFRQKNNEKYIMESTPGYFYGGKKLTQAMKKSLGEIKILIILREPLSRLFSFYKFKKSMVELERKLSFDDYIQQCRYMSHTELIKQENNKYWGIEGGFYAKYLDDWFQNFKRESIKVVFFDSLKSNSVTLLQEICQWLEIDDRFYDSTDLQIENKTVGYNNKYFHKAALAINLRNEKILRANPQIKKLFRKAYYAINAKPYDEIISKETTVYLKSLYAPYNRQLANYLIAKGYTNIPDWLNFSEK